VGWGGCRYINWLQAETPSDVRQVLRVLERCTRKFQVRGGGKRQDRTAARKDDNGDGDVGVVQGDEQYRNDPRYLKAWIAYADQLASPGDIFKVELPTRPSQSRVR
jgi:hypothetical protein